MSHFFFLTLFFFFFFFFLKICERWLKIIEKEVDNFLEKQQYNHDVLPYDYLNCILTDEEKEIVEKNLSILGDVFREGVGGRVEGMLGEVTGVVYKMIDPFLEVCFFFPFFFFFFFFFSF